MEGFIIIIFEMRTSAAVVGALICSSGGKELNKTADVVAGIQGFLEGALEAEGGRRKGDWHFQGPLLF